MAVRSFDLGDDVKVTGTFTDEAAALLDPESVFVTVKPPNSAEVTYEYGVDEELEHVADSGVYTLTVDANEDGVWYVRFYSTGTGKASEVVSFVVTPLPWA